MTHKVVNTFKEKNDANRIYYSGAPYPAGDFKPTKKRIEELSTLNPKYNLIFIEKVQEDEVVESEVAEEVPIVEAENKPKKKK